MNPKKVMVFLCAFAMAVFTAKNVDASSFVFTKIADTNTQIPSGTVKFNWFTAPKISGNDIAFLGGEEFSPTGLYTYVNGSLNVVAKKGDPILAWTDIWSEGQGVLDTFYPDLFSIAGGKVAFYAESQFYHTGIISDRSGGLEVVVDNSAAGYPVYGEVDTRKFCSTYFNDVSIDGQGNIAFIAETATETGNCMANHKEGVYISPSTGEAILTLVADNTYNGNDTIFTDANSLSLDGGNLAFLAHRSS